MASPDLAARDSDSCLRFRFAPEVNDISPPLSPRRQNVNTDYREHGGSNSRTESQTPAANSEGNNIRPTRPSNLLDFFVTEVTRGYALENDEARYSEKRKKVYAFMKIPRELESFIFYGFIQCTDAFLYIFTLLPIRFVLGLWHLFGRFATSFNGNGKTSKPGGSRRLAPSEICDLLKVFIILTSSLMMTFVDTSWMYHIVRGQAVIKLYIFYNMLEVADKLFSSFGQDILDALFWTATEPHSSTGGNRGASGQSGSSGSKRRGHLDHLGMGTIPHLCIAVFYVVGHAILVLFQATTLNVAFNSHNKALLTIMLSNNFVELKGSVFKKFAKNNLFQMACSDVRERFHNLILLSVVVVRNMTAVNWRLDHFWEMVPDMALLIFGEFLVDWLKHAFITKFNEIPSEVYRDFTITIAYDVAKSRQKTAFSDHSDQVSRRMGFIPLPLGVVMIRIFNQSISRSSWQWWSLAGLFLTLVAYLVLLTLRLLNSIILLGEACKHIETYEEMQKQAEFLKRLRKQKAKSLPTSPKLSLIEFNDVMQQNHQTTRGYTVSDILQQAAEELANFAMETSQQTSPLSPVSDIAFKPHRRSKSVANFSNSRSRHVSERKEDTGAAGGVPTSSAGEKSGVIPASPFDVTAASPMVETGVGGSQVKPKPQTVNECESLHSVDRYTLCNDDRIVS